MKKIFLFFILICFLFVGCKTTKDAGEVLPPESQTESTEQVEIEEVPPVDENLDEIITEQGDLPLPFDQDFDLETDEFASEDEFFYGDDFVPENQFPENTEVEVENEPELVVSDGFIGEDDFFTEEEFFDSQSNEIDEIDDYNEVENEISENQEENLSNEIESEVESEVKTENETQVSEDLIEKSNSTLQEVKDNNTELTQNISNKTEEDIYSDDKNTNPEEIKDLQSNVEPITRKEIVEIVEDILSKNGETSTLSNQTEVLENEENEKIVPSRTVYAAKNQTILVSYPGNNWVYLGELESQSIVAFKGKTFSDNLTTFKILPQNEGCTVLHFYKLDTISGKYIDDYLEVVISPIVDDSNIQTTVTAPEYSYDKYLLNNQNSVLTNEDVLPTVEVISNDTDNFDVNKNNSNSDDNGFYNSQDTIKAKDNETSEVSTPKIEQDKAMLNKELAETEVVEEEPELLFLSDIFDDEETETVDSNVNDNVLYDDDLLKRAKTAYENKDFENALSLINKFLELSNFSIDEALFLKGQILEKPFANRNIRDALDCYKKIISSYPQSDLWDKADERIKYIQRFYFNIR